MSLIKTIIAPSALELVRDQIGAILAAEIPQQYTLTNDKTFLNVKVWVSRFLPFDKTEMSSINVNFAKGDIEAQSQVQSEGIHRFNIDCYTFAKSNSGQDGDILAITKLHKLFRVCRSILENPIYKTLGFAQPFIMNRHIESIIGAEPNTEDAMSTVMGRLSFVVRVPEGEDLIVPRIINGYNTTVKLELTDKGYLWIRNNYA